MDGPSPYDLNASAILMRKRQRERANRSWLKKTNSFRSPDGPSPYDLSSHGGLAGLAEKAREDPLHFR